MVRIPVDETKPADTKMPNVFLENEPTILELEPEPGFL